MRSHYIILVILVAGLLWAGGMTNDKTHIDESSSIGNVVEPMKVPSKPMVFDSTNKTFSNDTAYSLNVNERFSYVHGGYFTVASDGYTHFNLTFMKGMYINVSLLFEINKTANQGDLDMDVLFSNGTTWVSGMSVGDGEFIGPVEVPFTDEYIVVVYPYSNPYVEPIGNSADLIVQMLDKATAILDHNINMVLDHPKLMPERMPELPTGTSEWLWEGTMLNDLTHSCITYGGGYCSSYERTPPSYWNVQENLTEGHSEIYKVWLEEGSKVRINISYLDPVLFSNPTNDTVIVGLTSLDLFLDYSVTVQEYYEKFGRLDDFSEKLDFAKGDNRAYYEVGQMTWLTGHILEVKIPKSGWHVVGLSSAVLGAAQTTSYTIELKFVDRYDQQTLTNDHPTRAVYLGAGDAEEKGLTVNTTKPDYFNVSVRKNSRLIIDIIFDRHQGQVNLYLFDGTLAVYPHDEDLALVGMSDFTDQNQQQVELLVFTADVFYIKINTTSTEDVYYDLIVTVGPIDDSYEPNNNIMEAPLLPGAGGYDLFFQKGDEDFFSVFLFKDDVVNVSLFFNGTLANLNLEFYDDSAIQINKSISSSSSVEEVVVEAKRSGIYFIRVRGVWSSFLDRGLDYNLVVTIDEEDDQFEPNDAPSTATPIQDGIFQNLAIRAGDEDWYRIYLKDGEGFQVSVGFDTSKGDIDLVLYDSDLTTILNSSQSFTQNEELSYLPTSNGEVFLRVALFGGQSVIYELHVLIDELDSTYEDNDDFSQAYPLNATYHEGIEARGGDYDYYLVNVPMFYALVVELTFDVGQDFSLAVFSNLGGLIDYSDGVLNTEIVGPFGVTQNSLITIRVFDKLPGLTNYDLNITVDLASVLVPPPIAVIGDFLVPHLGFPASSLLLTNVSTTVSSTVTTGGGTTTTSGLSPIGGIIYGAGGLSVGLGVGGGGALVLRRRFGS